MNAIPLVWWGAISFASVINVGVYLLGASKSQEQLPKNLAPNPGYRTLLQRLAGVYVFVCAFRSLLPRIDVERICFWDSSLSSISIGIPSLLSFQHNKCIDVVAGRSVATVAELAFAAEICIAISSLASDFERSGKGATFKYALIRMCTRVCFVAIILAEFCSWTGVITGVQVWNASEESLWCIVTTVLLLCCGLLYIDLRAWGKDKPRGFRTSADRKAWEEAWKSANNFLIGYLIVTPPYILYLFLVDVPMYYSRWQASGRNLPQWAPTIAAFANYINVPGCFVVTRDFDMWKEDMIWMGGYFTVAVWGAMWIASNPPRLPPSEHIKGLCVCCCCASMLHRSYGGCVVVWCGYTILPLDDQ